MVNIDMINPYLFIYIWYVCLFSFFSFLSSLLFPLSLFFLSSLLYSFLLPYFFPISFFLSFFLSFFYFLSSSFLVFFLICCISQKFHTFKQHCLCQSCESFLKKNIDWMIERLYDLSLYIYFSFPLLLYFIVHRHSINACFTIHLKVMMKVY